MSLLPEIQVPLNLAIPGNLNKISSKVILLPIFLIASSGGETRMILKAIKPRTVSITNNAINIPFQFRSLGDATTKSCKDNKEKLTRKRKAKILERKFKIVFFF